MSGCNAEPTKDDPAASDLEPSSQLEPTPVPSVGMFQDNVTILYSLAFEASRGASIEVPLPAARRMDARLTLNASSPGPYAASGTFVAFSVWIDLAGDGPNEPVIQWDFSPRAGVASVPGAFESPSPLSIGQVAGNVATFRTSGLGANVQADLVLTVVPAA